MRFGMRALLLAVLIIAFAVQGTRVGLDYFHEKKRGELARLGTGRAFLIHEGEVLLLREGNAFGAFIPKSQRRAAEVVEYYWYYRTDGKGTFDAKDPAVKHGTGISTQPTTDINVKFGPFAFQWSGCDPGWGWVYYRPSETNATAGSTSRFCLVRGAALSDIDASSPRRIYVGHGEDPGIRGDETFKPSEEAPREFKMPLPAPK
jgi:hypothetical protein